LKHLGLYAPLVLGTAETVENEPLQWLLEGLAGEDLAPEVLAAEDSESLIKAESLLLEGRLPVFVLNEPKKETLADLVGALLPRKLVFLRGAGGLGPSGGSRIELSPGHYLPVHESGIGVINLRSDEAPLISGDFLVPAEVPWLSRCRYLLERLEERGITSSTISIASPLSLLQELFTVRGEGTLVKLGAQIETLPSYEDVDLDRLSALIRESFGRPILPHLFQRAPLALYLERDYRGLALVEEGCLGAAYLSKFAVSPIARGEGLGQDLWWSVARAHPAFYWRSRGDNPINSWYAAVCDGMQRSENWNVYWRGIPIETLAETVRDALARPVDLRVES
jgi:hypothetical protein